MSNENVDPTPEQIEAAAQAKAKQEAEAAEREKAKGNVTDREAELLKEVMAKKEALKEAKQVAETEAARSKELEAKLAAFGDVNLEKVKELLKAEADRETAELEKRGEFDRVKEQMREAHRLEVEAAKAEFAPKVESLSAELSKRDRIITELTIGRGFSESTFIRESLALPVSKARILYGDHFELTDGKIVAYDKPAGSATRTPLVDADGEPLSFDKAIEKIVDQDPDRDNLLKSKIRSGAGSDNDPAIAAEKKKDKLTGLEAIREAVRNGGLPSVKGVF